MINKLLTPYNLTQEEKDCITAANNNWSSQRGCIELLKDDMHEHFDEHQNEKCCYCGLLYDRTGRGEIDHIAPQGARYYPQFSFTPLNLAKACQLCNCSSMKHQFDTVAKLDADYDKCQFKIVHPYKDDHNWHYAWKYGLRNVVISVNNDSDQARESIKLFELDKEKRTRMRATQRNQAYIDRVYDIKDAVKQRIKSVLTFR